MRSILAQRKWTKMKQGFIALQQLYRKKIHSRETKIWRQLKSSEREFQIKLNALKERRKIQEKIFQDLKQKPSGQFQNMLCQSFANNSESKTGKEYQESMKKESSSELLIHPNDIIKENAVRIIQVAIRKWLHNKRREHLARSYCSKIRENSKDKISILAPFDNRIIIDFKSNSFKYSIFSNFRAMCRCQPFLNKPITEERAIKLQQEIDSWQHHHRVSELNLKVVLLPSNITTLKYYSLGPCDESK